MTKQTINVGTSPNDNRGDSLRASFQKINANFTELYTALGINADVTLNIGAFEFAGSVMSTTDSSAIVIDQAVTVSSNLTVGGDVLPSVALGGDLGSSARPWRSLYVSNNTIFLGGTALSVNGAGNLLVNGSQITGGTTSYNDLTNKPTIPTSFDRLVNGAYELVVETDGIISSVAFPERDGGKVYLSGVELFAVPADPESTDPFPLILSSQQGNVRIKSNAIGPMFEWRFGTDGDLEIPGNIKSNGNINIEINIGDSTLRRWQFGEDGALTFPDGTNQTTAWTGSTTVSSLVNGARTVSLGSDGALTIPGDIRSEGNINIDINLADSTLRRWQFGEDGNLAVPGDINLSGGTISQFSFNELTGLKLVANADQGQNVTIMGTGNNTVPILNYVGTTLSGITIGTPEGDWNFMNGNLTIPGDIRSEGNINIDINLTDSTLRRWQFGEDGALTFPDGTNQTGKSITVPMNQVFDFNLSQTEPAPTGSTSKITIGPFGLTTDNTLWRFETANSKYWDFNSEEQSIESSESAGYIKFGTATKDNTGAYTDIELFSFGAGDGTNAVYISAGGSPTNNRWKFGGDGALTIPGDIRSESNINIDINLTDSTLRRWQFGEDGILTLPSTGKISNSGYDWTFGSNGGLTFPDSTVQTTAYPGVLVPANGDGVSGNANMVFYAGTDWYNTSKVTINPTSSMLTLNGNSGTGGITFPDNTVQTTAYTGSVSDLRSEGNINIEINLSDSTLRRWQFGEDGALTLPNGAVIKDTADAAVAFGQDAGTTTQGAYSVAVGASAGSTTQGVSAVAIGYLAGATTQGQQAVAVGISAGGITQGSGAVAIGNGAGYNTQGVSAVAIGVDAGLTTQGVYAVAIGEQAGETNQAANTIILNATGSAVNGVAAQTSSFYVAPIRNASGTSGLLQYDATTKEVSYSSDILSNGNINIDINLTDSTLRRWQFGEDGNLTLPAGGNISEGGGLTGGAIRLTPAGGANANQALLIYPTVQGEGDHVHLTTGGGTTELYLGDDIHYVKLGKGAPYNGTIVIAATGWPNTVVGIISSGGDWAVESLSNLATTGGTGTGLTVTVTQVAGVANAIAIVSGPMGGYTANDTITVTSGAATATFVISVLAPQWIFAPDGDLYLPPGNIIRDLGNGNDIRSIPGPYADDAAAQAAGVAVGNPYHKTGTSGQVFVRLT